MAADLNQTQKLLDAITDEGLFEQLAMAMLRRANPAYSTLIHTGVNADGKTIKSPVDGIAVVPGPDAPHLILPCHTTCRREDLRKKWLYDPNASDLSKSTKAPEGDLIKASNIAGEERDRTPNIAVTVVLTTNREPTEDLVRDVQAEARKYDFNLDIWSRSRLSDFLDHHPDGQYLRKRFLGLEQELLSKELLHELSAKSLETYLPPDSPGFWVERRLDGELAEAMSTAINARFLVADSGFGKSTACYKLLHRHYERGGCGLVLPPEAIAASPTLDMAIDSTLHQLHSTLQPNSGTKALALCSDTDPLLIIVDDINKALQPALLLERIAGWAEAHRRATDGVTAGGPAWRLVCPVWPQILAQLGDLAHKTVSALSISAGPLEPEEGRNAVERRIKAVPATLSGVEAQDIAESLGYDPLLIALYNFDAAAEPKRVIDNFISRSLERLAVVQQGAFTAPDYRIVMLALGRAMLERRVMAPTWRDLRSWFSRDPDKLAMLGHIVNRREIVRVSRSAEHELLAFRHDRVRETILLEAFSDLFRSEQVSDDILAEPFYAELIGAALINSSLPAMWAKCVGAVNPLALFYALRGFRTPSAPVHHAVVAAIRTWLTDPAAHSTSHQYLRRAAQIALAGTDSPLVIEFANQFRDLSRMLMEARFRNGDVRAGIELCSRSDPGITDPWRDRLIAHTFSKFGRKLIDPLDSVLRDSTRPEAINLPALHLAGHIGSSQLLDAITACFSTAKFSAVTIAGFLWAFAQCSGNEPETLLGAVCDVWASLPDEGEGVGRLSQRGEVAHEIISAFSRLLPEPALRFFIARAAGDDVLRDDIVYLLSRVDHPEAVEFVARQLSDIDRRLAGTDKFLPFSHMATDHWRAERRGVQMSANSRERLKNLWLDLGNDRYLRRRAFALWAAGAMDCDLLDLRSVGTSEPIFDEALATRMVVGDRSAIPIFLSKLKGSPHREYWWQFSRNHWSDELSVALDEELKGRRQQVELAWDQKEFVTDWISSELIIRMAGAYSAESAAEAILAEHWDHVQFSSYFVQAALYIATPGASELAARALRTSPTPEQLFRFINQRFGVKTFGHPSVTDIRRLDSLVPYLDFIDPRVIYWFWELCNERHWLDWRRQHLDARITDRARASTGLDDSQLVADLNTMMSTMQNGRLGNIEFQLYHWLQRFAERGDPPDRAMRIVETWLNDRRTLDALRLVATAVIYGGGRPDLARLNVDGIAPSELAEATRFNARFAVFRRTLV